MQFAIQNGVVYVLEVIRALHEQCLSCRRRPVCHSPKSAATSAWGAHLTSRGWTSEVIPQYYSVKEAVFPFIKFLAPTRYWARNEVDGRSMGVGQTFAGLCSNRRWRRRALPSSGKVV